MMSDEQQDQPETFDSKEVQALHRRLLAAKDAGEEPTEEDKAMRDRVMASPYAMFDRPWASDDR